jgi:hypothetical protein
VICPTSGFVAVTRSPDERSDIRDDVRAAPDVAPLIRATKLLEINKFDNHMSNGGSMAETIVRFIGALIQAAFELLVQHTGKKALSLWGRQVESLYRIADWSGRLECRRTSVGRSYCSAHGKTMTMPNSPVRMSVAATKMCREVVLRAGP